MRHIKTFRIFEKFLSEDLIETIVNRFGEHPDIFDVVNFCYDNFARITGLPQDGRDNSEAEFPQEIKDIIQRFDFNETDFIETWESVMEEKDEDDDMNWQDSLDLRTDIRNLEMDLQDLKDRREQLLIDQEQEAEPQGGPIADDYGDKLQEFDDKIEEVKKALSILKSKL